MIRKYRKKPVVIEAVQFDGVNYKECKEFIGEASYNHRLSYPNVETPEGTMEVSVNDFIIKGVKGEFYPCKPDIFKTTYEQVLFAETGSDR